MLGFLGMSGGSRDSPNLDSIQSILAFRFNPQVNLEA